MFQKDGMIRLADKRGVRLLAYVCLIVHAVYFMKCSEIGETTVTLAIVF